MPAEFDLRALHAALDDRRAALGLSWSALGAELGVAAATLRALGERSTAEADGVLRAIAWLGRSPESFVTGRAHDASAPALSSDDARTLRFDAAALYDALDAARSARGLTWPAVAAATGAGNAAALKRLRDGVRVAFPGVMRLLVWLDAPAARFVRPARRLTDA